MKKEQVFEAWRRERKAIPILFFPAASALGFKINDLVYQASAQADAMKWVNAQYEVGTIVGMMDLSVEAEAFGSMVKLSECEVPNVTNKLIATPDDAKQLLIPVVGSKRTKIYPQAIHEVATTIHDKPIIAGVIGPFSLAGRLMGMTEIMMNCYDEPEMVHIVLDKVKQFIIEYINEFKKAGANGILMAEPAAGLLSPTLCQEFSSDIVGAICKEVKADDFIFIYHNCGNVLPLLKGIMTIGADAYHFGEATDLVKVMAMVPSNTFILGNISPSKLFQNGTPERIYEATTQLLLSCWQYDHFILSSGCDIPPSAPIENIDSFFKSIHDFKK